MRGTIATWSFASAIGAIPVSDILCGVVEAQIGSIDSDVSTYVTNSIVLCIPASQGVPGRRKVKDDVVVGRTFACSCGVTVGRPTDGRSKWLGDRRFG